MPAKKKAAPKKRKAAPKAKKKAPAKKKPAAKKAPKGVKKKAPARLADAQSKRAKAPAKTTEKKTPTVRASGKTPTLLRGMKDVLPKDQYFWYRIFDTARSLARAYGFGYTATPVLEEASLFVRTIGKGTDIVDKEMYIFEDKDGKKVCLRPEFTASYARAYIDHGMHNVPQPVKFWHVGPAFRHERPQAGRYRQLHQFNAEVLGERDPEIDAELIVMAYNFYRDLGINTQVRINSIGTLEDRERYIVELVGYLRSKRSYLSEESKKRITKNPLRVLDSKDEQDRAVVEEAPQIIDWLSDDSKGYFMKVLEYLDDLDVPYMLDSTLVRGLDYYSDTVFEFYEDNEDGSSLALGGGGRYDGLVEQLGGRPTPGCGFGLGIERVITVMRRIVPEDERMDSAMAPIFFAQLGEQARRRALRIVEDLRRADILVYHNLAKKSLKAQMELANKVKATHALILGQKEVQDGTIIIRDMDSGIQEIVDQKKVRQELERMLSR